MSLTINTTKLKEMVSRSMQAVSNNSSLPITGMLNVSVKDNVLTLLTTDKVNYLYVTEEVKSEDMQVTVNAEAFAKLVGKLTTENTTLTVKGSSLEIIANGVYNLEIPMDENGVVNFSCPYATETVNEYGVWKLSDIKSIINTLKPSLAVTADVPMYMNYYVGDDVIATNEITVSCQSTSLLNTSKLISAKSMDLLESFRDDTINYEVFADNIIVFKSSDSTLMTMCYDSDEFPIDVINTFIEMDMGEMCVFSKSDLLSALDRLSLFVGAYDNNAIKLVFAKDGLTIESLAGNGIEKVPYIKHEEGDTFACSVDVRLLQTHVKSQSDDVELWYGADNCIKLEGDNTTVVIALTE